MSSQHLGDAQLQRQVEQWREQQAAIERAQQQAEQLRQQQQERAGGRS
ncbi:hypothetical protein GCM10010495_74310 [Kitasatospora herbaricolor]|nr:hypothetical protein [Kitasatospora herbaricolor]MDQ0305482.1 multidrug efflux pump subunit AcrA (membrane-fusion protein) [Kitasatospora herbaricolor]GGV45814.1 hypothetical protein GCM10010495_74310 [Kitasatospora herbaricolor]